MDPIFEFANMRGHPKEDLMTFRNTRTLVLVSCGAFFLNVAEPTAGIQLASAQTPQNVRVRIDFRTLYCKNTTGDEPGADEPYVKYLKLLPGSAPTLGTFAPKGTNAGEYVWDGDNRRVIWEGVLAPGQAAAFIVNVMEDDGAPPDWQAWASNTAKCGGAVAAAASGAGAPAIVGCAGLALTIMRAINGDDEIGQFTVTVKNENGVVKKTLRTAGKKSQIGGYGDPALSDSGKTIRMRLGQGESNDQRYQASLQVRSIPDPNNEVSGDALTWTVTGRDDAK
jgi:hypothetical protein